MNPTKKSEIAGRTAAMEDLALHHFLMGLFPRISNTVRCRSPKNLNEAIGYAISEEKIQQTLYQKNYKPPLQGQQTQPKQIYRQVRNKFPTGQFRPFQGPSHSYTHKPQGQFMPRPQGQIQNFRTPYRPFQGPSNTNNFQHRPQGFQGQVKYNQQQQQQPQHQFNRHVNFIDEEGYDETDYSPGYSPPEEQTFDDEENVDYGENNDDNEEYNTDNLNE